MKRKGFTLIELLAVIVILSVITLITIPMVTNVIEESKKKALVSSVQGILDSTEYFTMNHETGVYEFLFDEEHQGSTIKGESLDYRGTIDGKGKLYLDKEGNVSVCISNDKYYAYKNYNSGTIVGERKAGNCIIGFDALTNKYVAMLDNGTGNVSNVYSKDEVNNLVDSLGNVYATKEELNDSMNNLSSMIATNQTSIHDLNSKLGDQIISYASGTQVGNNNKILELTVPEDGTYILNIYNAHAQGVWLGKNDVPITNFEDEFYMICSYSGSSKLFHLTKGTTLSLWNLNGSDVTYNKATHLELVRLK